MARAQAKSDFTVTLGQVNVGAEIGRGGFGVVREASIAGIDFPFAIKLLDPSKFNDLETARSRFFREAEVLLKLRHPHIIAIYGVGEHEEQPYILMERFRGQDLHRVREKNNPAPETVLPFIGFMADALGYAHSKGVVHRDVKPTNLMTQQGDGRVLDFGLASVLDPVGTRFTRTGGGLAGDTYTAPELLDNPALLDPRCDVYSLGACWFWLLVGRAPKGLNFEAALRQSAKVPAEYERVVLRCLDQPDARYPSMQELADDVAALRNDRQQRTAQGDVTDEDAIVLSVMASACPAPGDSTSFYHVEQEISGSIGRLELGIANRRLIRFGFIETFTDPDGFGDSVGVRLTRAGERWIEEHKSRVAILLDAVQKEISRRKPQSNLFEDFPF